MLVLTRKLDESIIVGENIEIKIIEIRGDQVRLGIDAPRSVSIYRKELYEKMKEMKEINTGAVKSKEEKVVIPFNKKGGGEENGDKG